MFVSGSTIETLNRSDYGVFVEHGGENADPNTPTHIDIDVRTSNITTNDYSAHGVRGYRRASEGNVDIDVRDTTISTMGDLARGIDGYHTSVGDIVIFVEDTDITTMGAERAPGIRARLQDLTSDNLDTAGDIRVTMRGGSITTHSAAARVGNDDAGLGNTASGIEAYHSGSSGSITIDVQDVEIRTEGTAVSTDQIGTLAHGIYALFQGNGNIDIDARGGSITTKGSYSYGIYATHSLENDAVGDGHIAIDTHPGHSITTTGDNAHGIVAYHYGDEDSRSIAITVGGDVYASGLDAQGVRVGVVNADGEPERVAGMGGDGYRRQTVTVNGRAQGGSGQGAGVFLAGGGRVYIGPQGTVGAASGIAIHASGGDPKLLVDMNLDGRQVAEVIGDDWIVNDSGETTIVVNGVTLHDGATGVTGNSAPNGAFEVTIREDGVTVDTGTDPWTVSERSPGIVLDRDFSGEDFEEALRFSEEYAPRAALYESLPDLLLRLSGPGPAGRCLAPPASPTWARLSSGKGSYRPNRSTVGAAYDADRFAVEAGVSVALGEDVAGAVSIRRTTGTVQASSPTGGGGIDVEAGGPSFALRWAGANGAYALGCLSYSDYDMDLSTRKRGLLEAELDGSGHVLAFETGWRFAVGEGASLTPRAWLVRSKVSVDDFTDAVNSRVSISGQDRVTVGIGAAAETAYARDEGELLLRGSLDLERIVSGASTRTEVSGETLSLTSERTSASLGLGAVFRKNDVSLGADLFWRHAFGANERDLTGLVSVSLRF